MGTEGAARGCGRKCGHKVRPGCGQWVRTTGADGRCGREVRPAGADGRCGRKVRPVGAVDRCGRKVRSPCGLSAVGFRLWELSRKFGVGSWELGVDPGVGPPTPVAITRRAGLRLGPRTLRPVFGERRRWSLAGQARSAGRREVRRHPRPEADLFQPEDVELAVGHHEHLAVVDRWNREADANRHRVGIAARSDTGCLLIDAPTALV